ncbi:MAG: 4Fe-4S binding protein [Tannerella sp.]|jgi:NAD-dependent dihydropyrimidine dehydrogenase PreA subunit|nr:4Fe-4S binding protein [Tannerella sp.]
MKILYIIGGLLLLWITASVIRGRKNRNKVLCIDTERCTGCGRCVKRCTRKVIETVKEENTYAVVRYPERCTGCGDCIAKCKFGALQMTERQKIYR